MGWGLGTYSERTLTSNTGGPNSLHEINADVTLACERCYVTNGYLQRLVRDRSVFLKRDKKCYVFK